MKRGSRLDELLTLLFMVAAVGALVCFFVLDRNHNPTYLILGGIAVLMRIAQYIMRMF